MKGQGAERQPFVHFTYRRNLHHGRVSGYDRITDYLC